MNNAMLCDFYEITMSNGYFVKGLKDKISYFDLYFRTIPDNGGFAITAGLEQLITYLENLHFTQEDIFYFQSKGIFDKNFLEYLEDFRFTGDVWAIPEGTPVFPGEPLVTVRAPAIEAQLVETFALLTINHQSLIATKANRIVRAAGGRPVMEFGARRAQGSAAAAEGARAAFIGGCAGTSCVVTDELYGAPALGTMAHSWIQMFDSEYEAFKAYCQLYPHEVTLLVDTYNTLQSGVPNAIRAFKEVLIPQGITSFGIRLDSGDIAYLAKQARKMLDEAGLSHCKIVASNSLDEWLIRDLIAQGADIDSFGVGERLITAKSDPVFSGVYKLAAVENASGTILPRIKISENVGKITTPHFKKIYRLYDKHSGKAFADQICVFDEAVDETKPLTLFDPHDTWKKKIVSDFFARDLRIQVMQSGKRVYASPSLPVMQKYCLEQVDTLWDEVKRFENPHNYYVDLSRKLWFIKHDLIEAIAAK